MSQENTSPSQGSGPKGYSPPPEEGLGDFSLQFEDSLLLGRFDQAEMHLNSFRSRFGETPQFFYSLARLRQKQGKLAKAYELFKKLFYEFPVFMATRRDYDRIQEDLITQPLEKAKAHWNMVLMSAARIMEDGADDPPSGEPGGESTGQSLQQAKEAKAAHVREIEKTIDVYREILAIESHQLQALRGLVLCFTELGKGGLVLEAQEKTKAADEHWQNLNNKRGAIILTEARRHTDAGEFERAIGTVNLGIEAAPTNMQLLAVKSEALIQLKKFKEAQSCVSVMARVNANSPDTIRLRKRIESNRFEHDLDRGLEILMEAEGKPPGSHPQALKAQEAAGHFLEALGYDQHNLTALSGVYRCHVLAGNPLKAQKALERITEIDPEFDVNGWRAQPREKTRPLKAEPCFVATRLFGPGAPETLALRAFRERTLRATTVGRVFIAWYRRLGPALAALAPDNPVLPVFRHLISLLFRTLKR
jgi:tetratricopeptide (TPR) repeat protein